MRQIIEATADGADAKAKSRWTRCLRFAARRRVKPKDVLWFIQHRGGVSGCAEMFAAGDERMRKLFWTGVRLSMPIEHDEDWDPLLD